MRDDRIHLPHETAYLVGPIPGDKTTKTWCGLRRDMERVTWVPDDLSCDDCRKSFLRTHIERLAALQSLEEDGRVAPGMDDKYEEAVHATAALIQAFSPPEARARAVERLMRAIFNKEEG